MHSFIAPSGASCTEQCDAAALRQFLMQRRITFLKRWVSYKFPEVIGHIDPDYDEALKGTQFHDILKRQLQFYLLGLGEKFDLSDALEEAGGDDYETGVMYSIISDIVEQAKSAKQVWIEKRFENEGVDSGGSPDFAMITADTVVIRDLKTGRLDVKADNPQFKRYACGVMDKLGWPQSIDKVLLKVDAIHFAGGFHTMTMEELINYRDNVFHSSMLRGNLINPKGSAGDHCVYCSARIHCPEFREYTGDKSIDQLFNMEFTEITVPQLETMWERIRLLNKAEEIVKAEMISRMKTQMDDDEFTKYRLSNGRKYKRIKDEVGLKEYLKSIGCEEKDLYMSKLKTINQLINSVKGCSEEAIEPYIERGYGNPSIVLK